MKKFLVFISIILASFLSIYLWPSWSESAVTCDKISRTYELNYEATGSWLFSGTGENTSGRQNAETQLKGLWTRQCVSITSRITSYEHLFEIKDALGKDRYYQIYEEIDHDSHLHRIKATFDIGKIEFHTIRDFLARIQFTDGIKNWQAKEQDSNGDYRVNYEEYHGENEGKTIKKSGFESLSSLAPKVTTLYSPNSEVRYIFHTGSTLSKVEGFIGTEQSISGEKISESKIKFSAVLSNQKRVSDLLSTNSKLDSIEDDFQGTESFKRIERDSNLKILDGANWRVLASELQAINKDNANSIFLRIRAYFSLNPDRSTEALEILQSKKADELAFRTTLDALLQIDDRSVEATLMTALSMRQQDSEEARYMLQSYGLKEHAGKDFLESLATHRENSNKEISHAARLALGNISQTVNTEHSSITSKFLDEEIARLKISNDPAELVENLHVISNYGGQKSLEVIELYLSSKDELVLETAVTCLRFAPNDLAKARLLGIIKDERLPGRIQHQAIEEMAFHPLDNGDIEKLSERLLVEKSEAVIGSLISVLAKYYDKSETVVNSFNALLRRSVSEDVKNQVRLIAQRNG